ncbi:hypothetical protein BXU10_12765 [Flavobacterium sp. LM4]|nr:hypothetical protein BXU10_12765 [Flavobacterium sp. LM4]
MIKINAVKINEVYNDGIFFMILVVLMSIKNIDVLFCLYKIITIKLPNVYKDYYSLNELVLIGHISKRKIMADNIAGKILEKTWNIINKVLG